MIAALAAFVPVQTAGAVSGTATVAAVRGITGAAWTLGGNDALTPVFSGSYTSQGGSFLGAPAIVSVPASIGGPAAAGTPYTIVTGLDHDLWVRSATSSWARLSTVPAYCTSNPTATAVDAHAAGGVLLVVACVGTDGALWYAQEEPAPSDPSILPVVTSWTSAGGVVVGGPAVAAVLPAASVPAEITFFVNGTDGFVWTRTIASAIWSRTMFRCINQLAAASVVSPGGNVAAFVCEGADDQAAWAMVNRGSGWGAPVSVGGMLLAGPGLALGPNSWTVLAEGTDHALWQRSSATAAATFGTWASAGGYLTDGPSGAALLFQTASP